MVRYDRSSARRGSKYVKDLRGKTPGGGKALGGAGGIVMLLLAAFLGPDALSGLNLGDSTGTQQGSGTTISPTDDPDAETKEFMGFLMGDLNETWAEIFEEEGVQYKEVNLIIFDDFVETNGCGNATSAVGPFYCPAPSDQTAYIDFDFYRQLESEAQFAAPGDFAQAYVIAHEVGHHIQAITGTSNDVRAAQARDSRNKNKYAIALELQADCYAGMWAESASKRKTDSGKSIIEIGDIEEGLEAAAAVGDDRIQEKTTGQIDPHTWTHGSSEQRQQWFDRGLNSRGDVTVCDTFFEQGLQL